MFNEIDKAKIKPYIIRARDKVIGKQTKKRDLFAPNDDILSLVETVCDGDNLERLGGMPKEMSGYFWANYYNPKVQEWLANVIARGRSIDNDVDD